jgi:hypothetical protein
LEDCSFPSSTDSTPSSSIDEDVIVPDSLSGDASPSSNGSGYSSADRTSTSRPKDTLSNLEWFAPLYSGAEVTLCGGLCAIMQFCTQNKLTYTAIDELLQLLSVLCPPTSCLPRSFFYFKKFFQMFTQDHVHHRVCLKCRAMDCACPEVEPNDLAHLVNLEVGKPLEVIISSMLITQFSV